MTRWWSGTAKGRMPQARHCMIVHARYPVGETRVAREAAALVDAGMSVDVICLREPGELRREVVDQVRVHRLGVRRHRDRGMVFQLVEYLMFALLAAVEVSRLHLRDRFASVQIHNLPDFLVFSGLVPKLTGAAVILDLHDLMPEFFEARTGRSGLGRRLVELQERVACRFADHVITVSEGWRRDLAERGSVPLGRSSVVMNLADPDVFRPEALGAATEGMRDDGFHVVYHGTFTERYGVDVVVDAAALLRDRIPGLRVSLLGDGDQRSELEARIASADLSDVIEMSDGMLDVPELLPLLQAADVGVVPNRSNVFTDGILPTKLMEYVALEIPVVASRTRALEDYFDPSMVRYVPPGDPRALADALETLANSPDQAAGMVAAAETFRTKHSWPEEAASYVRTVRRVATSS